MQPFHFASTTEEAMAYSAGFLIGAAPALYVAIAHYFTHAKTKKD